MLKSYKLSGKDWKARGEAKTSIKNEKNRGTSSFVKIW